MASGKEEEEEEGESDAPRLSIPHALSSTLTGSVQKRKETRRPLLKEAGWASEGR